MRQVKIGKCRSPVLTKRRKNHIPTNIKVRVSLQQNLTKRKLLDINIKEQHCNVNEICF